MIDKGLYITQWIVFSAILIGLFFSNTGAQAGNWQEEMLYHPSADQLQMEQEGRVMIYDGLTSRQISQALDSQFERIGAMMFVRTIVTDERGEALRDSDNGEPLVEDDGC